MIRALRNESPDFKNLLLAPFGFHFKLRTRLFFFFFPVHLFTWRVSQKTVFRNIMSLFNEAKLTALWVLVVVVVIVLLQ